MKREEYDLSRIKHQLLDKKQHGQKDVIWQLSPEKAEYIRDLGYGVYPVLFTVKTRKFPPTSRAETPLLKSLHYAKCKGKYTLVMKLKHDKIKILRDHDVDFTPFKYRIVLN